MKKAEQLFTKALSAALENPALTELVRIAAENLMHARDVLHNAGAEFERRVHDVIAEELAGNDLRLAQMEKDVADVKEAQVGIAGAFRGRKIP